MIRLYSISLGMHPLMDHRIISTPRHSSLASANVVKTDLSIPGPSNAPAEKAAASDTGTTWWSPTTLGLGDFVVQAGWETLRDLALLLNTLYDEM